MQIGIQILVFLIATFALQGYKVFQKSEIIKSATTHQVILKAMQWQEVKY